MGDGTHCRGLSRGTSCDLSYDKVFLATVVKGDLMAGVGGGGDGAR